MEWQSSGSLLLASNPAEAEQLRARQELLVRAGVTARYLDERALRCEEPALHDSIVGGLLVSTDSQLVRFPPLPQTCNSTNGMHLLCNVYLFCHMPGVCPSCLASLQPLC